MRPGKPTHQRACGIGTSHPLRRGATARCDGVEVRLGPHSQLTGLAPPVTPLAAPALPRRDTIFKRREEILKNKDRELQESLIKFNKFLQDNDSKRNRAEKKVATHTHTHTIVRTCSYRASPSPRRY